MIKIKLITLYFLLFAFFVEAQDVKGEWRVLKTPNSIGQQSSIIKIASDNICMYDFNKFLFKHSTRFLDARTIQVGDTTLLEFEFIDANQNFIQIKSVDGKPTNKLKYVRLLPTIQTELLSKLKTALLKLKFKDNTLIFPLDRKFKLEELLVSDAAAIASDSISIGKRKSTYFLRFYLRGKVTNTIPIKEINEKELILYGVPSHKGEVYAEIINK